MMDFMESMRRGVDRAGFEVDRLLRASRVRSRLSTLRSQAEEEERQIGHHVVDLFGRGEPVHPELRDYCEKIVQLQTELSEREAELEVINQEVAPPAEQSPGPGGQPGQATCPGCGAALPADALFCHRCGVSLRAAQAPPQPPSEPEG